MSKFEVSVVLILNSMYVRYKGESSKVKVHGRKAAELALKDNNVVTCPVSYQPIIRQDQLSSIYFYLQKCDSEYGSDYGFANHILKQHNDSKY